MYTKVPLGLSNTPIEGLPKISQELNNEIYVKRDDLAGPQPGGNKGRKLEFIFGEAKRQNCDHIVTCGSTVSNHCRMTAMAANKLGFECTLVLSRTESDPAEGEPSFRGNYFLHKLLGARLKVTAAENREEETKRQLRYLKEQGKKPYHVREGGYGAVGVHGYVEAGGEIKDQSDSCGGKFDLVFLASSTGTTQAGLIIGNHLHRFADEIVGISVDAEKSRGKSQIRECMKDYCERNDLPFEPLEGEINFVDRYRQGNYGEVHKEVTTTIRKLASRESLLLDPVYTGKGFAGMEQYLADNGLAGKRVLFLHTGGLPILLGHSEKILG